MDKLDRIEDAVIELDKFSKSEKTLWDYKMLCDSLSVALYFGMHKSMYESMDEFDISKLNDLQYKVYKFMIDEIPFTYRGHIPDVSIFNPTSIQKRYPEYDIKWTNKLDALCDIHRNINIIMSYMLAIHASKGGDMIL